MTDNKAVLITMVDVRVPPMKPGERIEMTGKVVSRDPKQR